MKLEFLKLPSDERRLYFEQAAARRNVSPLTGGSQSALDLPIVVCPPHSSGNANLVAILGAVLVLLR